MTAEPYKASGTMPSGSFRTKTTIIAETPLSDEQAKQVYTCVAQVVADEIAAQCAPLASRINYNWDNCAFGIDKTYEISEGVKIMVKISLSFDTPYVSSDLMALISRALDELGVLLHILPGVWASEKLTDADWHPVSIADLDPADNQ